jgi:hypothetical protein
MIDVVEPFIEDRQDSVFASPKKIKISEVQIKRLVLTPMI